MSFAVIQTGGKQYKVKAGEILKIEKLDNLKANSKIEFKEVLAYGDDKMAEIGAPKIDGAKVEANLVKNLASSTASLPPPTSATSLSSKKNPSLLANAETPKPLKFCSDLRLSHLACAPVDIIMESVV